MKGSTLHGKHFEGFPKFKGGEEEWQEWSGDYKIMIDTRNVILGEAMGLVKKIGKTDSEVLNWKEVQAALVEEAGGVDDERAAERYGGLATMAK